MWPKMSVTFILCVAFLVSCAKWTADSSFVSATVPGSECYSLYSSIYRNATDLAPDEVIGIVGKPMPLRFVQSCFRPSTGEERQMVAAASKSSPPQAEWARKFDFGRPYILIPPSKADQAVDCIGINRNSRGCEAYAKLRFVRFLSIPIFNKDHSRALVAINRTCGGLCGNGGFQVYRKTQGTWVLESNSFVKCYWVS